MPVEIDNESHCEHFVRLNELWITEHFSLEESDRKLAADPFRIVREGGHILSLVEEGRVVGVCALLKEPDRRYQLARMAVEPAERGKGYGEALMLAALQKAREKGAKSVYLLSNTALAPAIALYRKHGFQPVAEGPHPLYARSNIVMELTLSPSQGHSWEQPVDPIDLDYARAALASQPFSVLIGARLVAFSESKAEIMLEITDQIKQQHGFVHGGVISYAVDNALTFAGGSVLGPAVVTSEFKINYLRPVVGSFLVARASVVHAGKNQAVCRCEVFVGSDQAEHLCAVAQGTIVKFERSPKPGA